MAILSVCTSNHDKPCLFNFCYLLGAVLFDSNNWKLHLLKFGLIVYISSGVLRSALQMINYLLSHKVQLSLQKFCIDLIHSLWLIGHLIWVLSYPGNANTIVETVIVCNTLLPYTGSYIIIPTFLCTSFIIHVKHRLHKLNVVLHQFFCNIC